MATILDLERKLYENGHLWFCLFYINLMLTHDRCLLNIYCKIHWLEGFLLYFIFIVPPLYSFCLCSEIPYSLSKCDLTTYYLCTSEGKNIREKFGPIAQTNEMGLGSHGCTTIRREPTGCTVGKGLSGFREMKTSARQSEGVAWNRNYAMWRNYLLLSWGALKGPRLILKSRGTGWLIATESAAIMWSNVIKAILTGYIMLNVGRGERRNMSPSQHSS